MRKRYVYLLLIIVAYGLTSCQKEELGISEICIGFSSDVDLLKMVEITKGTVIDTNDFILTISNSEGKEVFNGLYKNRPEKLEVIPGMYNIGVYSGVFDSPAFSSPQYGDKQEILVAAGQKVFISLECSLLNSGLQLCTSDEFREIFEGGYIMVTSDFGELKYEFENNEIGYFTNTLVYITLFTEDKEQRIGHAYLTDKMILKIIINVKKLDIDGFKIEIDSTRINSLDYITIGEDRDGFTKETALLVDDAIYWEGMDDMWVKGYIIGTKETGNDNYDFEPPFETYTNLIIATVSSERSPQRIFPIQIPTGSLRDTLSLVIKPENFGREILLKGDIEPYLGSIGMESVSEFEFIEPE
ncbi:MAG: DUF6359 domain-containing protein [Bacteroidales bacterium]